MKYNSSSSSSSSSSSTLNHDPYLTKSTDGHSTSFGSPYPHHQRSGSDPFQKLASALDEEKEKHHNTPFLPEPTISQSPYPTYASRSSEPSGSHSPYHPSNHSFNSQASSSSALVGPPPNLHPRTPRDYSTTFGHPNTAKYPITDKHSPDNSGEPNRHEKFASALDDIATVIGTANKRRRQDDKAASSIHDGATSSKLSEADGNTTAPFFERENILTGSLGRPASPKRRKKEISGDRKPITPEGQKTQGANPLNSDDKQESLRKSKKDDDTYGNLHEYSRSNLSGKINGTHAEVKIEGEITKRVRFGHIIKKTKEKYPVIVKKMPFGIGSRQSWDMLEEIYKATGCKAEVPVVIKIDSDPNTYTIQKRGKISSLNEFLNDRSISNKSKIHVLYDCAEIMMKCHQKKIVLIDFKPENITIINKDGNYEVRLIDLDEVIQTTDGEIDTGDIHITECYAPRTRGVCDGYQFDTDCYKNSFGTLLNSLRLYEFNSLAQLKTKIEEKYDLKLCIKSFQNDCKKLYG